MDLHTGALLVAEPAMLDPNFKQAVILLCEHGENGSFGLTINRPSRLHLPEVLTEPLGLDHQLYVGGPVQPDTLHFLHAYGEQIEAALPIVEGVAWGGPFEEIVERIRIGTLEPDGFRFFAGYAGWGPGQLQDEVAEGSWIVLPALREHVFDWPPEQLWRRLVIALGGELALLVNFPDEPQLN
jgi:putative transcriptional regulator